LPFIHFLQNLSTTTTSPSTDMWRLLIGFRSANLFFSTSIATTIFTSCSSTLSRAG
jgi:hypothetical protein